MRPRASVAALTQGRLRHTKERSALLMHRTARIRCALAVSFLLAALLAFSAPKAEAFTGPQCWRMLNGEYFYLAPDDDVFKRIERFQDAAIATYSVTYRNPYVHPNGSVSLEAWFYTSAATPPGGLRKFGAACWYSDAAHDAIGDTRFN